MPAAAVHAAFQSHLLNNWNQANAVIVEANTVTEPPSDPHIIVQYPVANGEKPSLGRRFFEEGAARIVLNVPVGTGLSTWLAHADTLATLFRETEFSGVRTFETTGPIIGDTNEEGNWLELAIIVPYRYQYTG